MKGAILPGVFEVTQESPSTEIIDRLGISTLASHACYKGLKTFDLWYHRLGISTRVSYACNGIKILDGIIPLGCEIILASILDVMSFTSFLTWSGSGPIL